MYNIIEYIQKYQYSFRKRPFNDVDALILSQFSYLKMKGALPGLDVNAPFVSLIEMIDQADDKKLFADERYEEQNRALVDAMLESRRYQNMAMNYYVDILDTEMEVQFSSVTFLLNDGTTFIAYRGTDENLVGWKEDFFLAFTEPGLGQFYASKYLTKVSRFIPGRLIVGGHSKGGNLAVFAAMRAPKSVQERIEYVYSCDGPGFKPEILNRYHYENIESRVRKILPKSSLVGMLMEQSQYYKVIESSSFGLMQHDPYTWLVEDDGFIEAEELDKNMKWMDETFNDWILSLDDEHIRNFTDILFDVLDASKAANLIDMASDWKKSMSGIMQGMKDVDEESVKFVQQVLKRLFVIGQKRYKQELQVKIEESKNELKEVFRKKK